MGNPRKATVAEQTRVRKYFFLHMRPNRVPAATLRYTHTFGLGGMSAVLAVLLVLTGALMMLAYEPTPGRAHDSILGLQTETLFGPLVRGLHFWSANLLIAVALLHMLRVFFTGAKDGPRKLNWVIGLTLLGCVLAANFTGYLLPWDQLSYWAVTICTGMLGYVPGVGGWLQEAVRGGREVGPTTLIIFYTIHTTVVPAAMVVLMGFHFWRIRKARGVVLPRPAGESAPTDPEFARGWPDLILRELAVGTALIAVVMMLAIFAGPDLGTPANPGMSPNPAKAPWYFVGFQELQIHFHPLFSVLVIPLAAVAGLIWWPYRRREADQTGVLFGSPVGRRTALIAALTGLILTPLLIIADEKWLQPTAWAPAVVGHGLVPFLILAAAVVGSHQFLRRRLNATREDADQAVFVLLATAFTIMTMTGVWFRGAGMALVWPW
ncbi:MAG: cytochrome b N-terminal domain-containing protein [Candidatus Krumholzibacteriota bacterium]